MLAIIVDHQRIPRSTTRQQWRALDRWVRKTRREFNERMRSRIENAILFGTSHPEIVRDAIDRIINPPVCIVDKFIDLYAQVP